MRLQNKVAVITGAADGIGKEIAVTMAREGANVVIADIQENKGSKAAKDIGGLYVHCDVGSEADVKQLMVRTVEANGTIDILMNNAAVAIDGKITEMPEEAWHKVMNVNLASVFRCCKHAIPVMLRGGGGSVISMASVQAHVGFEGWTAYAAAKGGIIAMTKQLAIEFASSGIRFNCISPATINTPMLGQVVAESPNPNLLQSWIDMHPIGRIGEPSEVANTALFLASSESSFITGVDLVVDGGLTLKP
jgi:NAD(P)-dependent dehydrogenase (short-subunit alcohol dehydrogenase family)